LCIFFVHTTTPQYRAVHIKMGRWDNLLNFLAGTCLVVLLIFRLYAIDSKDEVADSGGAENVGTDVDVEPSFLPPTPTALTGPQAMRPVVGRCAYGSQPGSHFRYEFCGYRSIRQHSGNDVYSLGHWKGKWITKEESGKTTFVGQEYEGGTPCGGGVRRRTSVIFICVKDAKFPQVTNIEEAGSCAYRMIVGTPQWCKVAQNVRRGQ
jgi:Glucosidase II beta subunit-like protein